MMDNPQNMSTSVLYFNSYEYARTANNMNNVYLKFQSETISFDFVSYFSYAVTHSRNSIERKYK